ncbi:2-C-methyl-D-erythritol 4-phosphate cytidylyltransferase, chloroplastic-like [Argentina anserina]|uniref:2-C-methyl-D-erythritol 4-phosphate cytidylyltransferase, chloroplastic-like n=1 Tax=Argentina anserina TaxID=57926 RepID=UPI0021766E05|nr:2-C-methyl-D-erythritol 4-phosphate cytidylyltransferase, chloroplastic-like [Potentilla anserina]
MGASMLKQYLPLLSQPIALYSFYTFSRMPEVKEIIVVCDPSYRDVFEDARDKIQKEHNLRNNSHLDPEEFYLLIFQGKAFDLTSELVRIHGSARPLVSTGDVEKRGP